MSRELILTVGLPCSGKTLFSRYLQGVKRNLFRVSVRDIFKMVDNKFREENVPKYLALQETLILRMLNFGSVIVDNMHLTSADRASVIRPARLINPNLKVTFYQMSRTLKQCKQDNMKRKLLDNDGFLERVSDDVLDKMEKSYQHPQISEDVQIINGVQWIPSDFFNIGNIQLDHKPKIFEIASKKTVFVVDKPVPGRSVITMSDEDE